MEVHSKQSKTSFLLQEFSLWPHITVIKPVLVNLSPSDIVKYIHMKSFKWTQCICCAGFGPFIQKSGRDSLGHLVEAVTWRRHSSLTSRNSPTEKGPRLALTPRLRLCDTQPKQPQIQNSSIIAYLQGEEVGVRAPSLGEMLERISPPCLNLLCFHNCKVCPLYRH